MSKTDRAKKRIQRKATGKPSAPRLIGANDNHANDNRAPVVIAGVLLTDGQAHRFYAAQDKLTSRDINVRRHGQRMMVVLEAELRERVEASATGDFIEARRKLEELRDITVGESSVEGAKGKLQIRRDGLEMLRKVGSLDSVQHAAGLRYRADYEQIDPERMLTPPSLDPARVKVAHGGDNWYAKRRQIEDRVFAIHLAICGVEAPTEGNRRALPILPDGHPHRRAIHALNEIAAKGRPVMDLATSGGARTRVRMDLIRGLNTCAIFYGLE